MSTVRALRTEYPHASDAAVNDVQIVDVVETTSDFHQLIYQTYKRSV